MEREVFQHIMMASGMEKLKVRLAFLKTVPLLSKISDDEMLRLSDAFEMVCSRISFGFRPSLTFCRPRM